MGLPVLPQAAATSERVLSFLEFVEALAVRTLRRDYNIPLPKIRDAVTRAERDYGMKHIFARRHRTVLFAREIFIYPDGQESPVQVSGRNPNQVGIRPVIEPHQRDLSFDDQGLTRLYRAFVYGACSVIMDPTVRFGEPYVESCGYTAKTLRDAVHSEGGVPEAAKAFGVAEDEVEVAYRYFDSLEFAA